MATGEKIGAYGLTEPSAGSDAGGMRTLAVKDGEDYILNGSKIFITNGGEADIYVVFARIDPNEKRTSAFIIEKDMPGFSVGKKKRNWAFAPHLPQKLFSRIAVFQKKIC